MTVDNGTPHYNTVNKTEVLRSTGNTGWMSFTEIIFDRSYSLKQIKWEFSLQIEGIQTSCDSVFMKYIVNYIFMTQNM